MDKILLIAHVVSAILLLGPVTVAISAFPKLALAARSGDASSIGAVRTMHSVSRTYGMISLLVPLLGFGVFFMDVSGYIKNGMTHASITLAVIAWAILFFLIIPRQRVMMAGLGVVDDDEDVNDADFIKRKSAADAMDWDKAKGQLAMFSGFFSAIWVVIAVLMFFL